MSVLAILNQKGRDVVTIKPGDSIEKATQILTKKRIGTLVVSVGEGSIDGILSERDIVYAIADGGQSVISRPVSEFMTSPVRTCREADSIEILMATMTGRRFRHIPVKDDNGRLCGIISIGDVVKQRIAEAEMITRAMQDYISTG